MRAHLVQLDIEWEQPEANFQLVRGLLATTDIQPNDLILLPEMFATGFSLNTHLTATAAGSTLEFLSQLAQQMRCFVQGGRTILPSGATKALNMMTVIGPTGQPVCEYAKVHPFSFGREPEQFDAGNRVEAWDWVPGGTGTARRCRVCPAICYDLRFPELFRVGAVRGADLFALGACWPAARQAHWRALAVARAIENQAFVLAVNRTGNDPHLAYAGGSIAVGPKGDVLGELQDQPAVLTVEIDPDAVESWRRHFPALSDLRLRDIR